MTNLPPEKELVASLARLCPHREHEAMAVAGWLCGGGIHYWRRLDLGKLVTDKEVRFCFWCSKIKIDGTVYTP